MRLRSALLCLGLVALVAATGEARAAGAAAGSTEVTSDACQRDNLWAEQVLFAEAAFVAPGIADDADADAARCTTETAPAEDCIAPSFLSAPRPRVIGRCDVRFGGAPRLHLRARGAHPTPFERLLADVGTAARRLQPASPPLTGRDAAAPQAAVLGAGPRPPAPPTVTLAALDERQTPLPSGHRGRIERPPR